MCLRNKQPLELILMAAGIEKGAFKKVDNGYKLLR